ncbi:hypothetical protein BU25DRAFT_408067 [Macroventuria anomochaeta]|uniref:Uncharacterized protein n=1 Tax=Macroventuria anomochaeta TaxID=301207 RepID=A0ACB6SC18_9PLEO|nr:uncharacterized protein BU25DRAFT_408067 [Macroventuria anomochaeta]KAF2630789.1 hypothetical protein BU25DRAFT_408067 [Macroventuria anomochaeta]
MLVRLLASAAIRLGGLGCKRFPYALHWSEEPVVLEVDTPVRRPSIYLRACPYRSKIGVLIIMLLVFG